MTVFYCDQLFDGERFTHRQCIEVLDGVVQSVFSGQPQQADVQLSGLVAPGYVDVQVNGGGGVLLNNQPEIATLETMFDAHCQFGTTAMLPTVITDNLDIMTKAADAVSQLIERGHKGIVGIHFEGPHLSVDKKGIHPDHHIRPLSQGELALFLRQDLGKVCVTLAPENVSVSDVKRLVEGGVLVCLGHSNATAEQVQQALDAGATGFTHLYNAMSPLSGRESGMVGIALLTDKAYCGLIVDHHHVSRTSCQLAIKCKSAQRTMLVTDAMSHVGSDQQVLEFAGMAIHKTGDKLTIAAGNLAGSTLDMAQAVANSVNDLEVPLGEALQMGSLTPATFLNLHLERGKIAPGFRADWVVLNDELKVEATYQGGQSIYNRSMTAQS